MTYSLRERDFATLEDMQRGALSMEVNLMEKRARMKAEKRVYFREESTSSTSISKMERMMEEMMKKMSLLERARQVKIKLLLKTETKTRIRILEEINLQTDLGKMISRSFLPFIKTF